MSKKIEFSPSGLRIVAEYESCFNADYSTKLSRLTTKPTKLVCAERRLRSAWASAQSDQSLRCPHEETLGP